MRNTPAHIYGESTATELKAWRVIGFLKVFLPAAAVICALVLVPWLVARQHLLKTISLQEHDTAQLASSIIKRDFGRALADVNYLARIPSMQAWLNTPGPATHAALREAMALFVESTGAYDQARIIGPNGMELIRVNLGPEGALIVGEQNLQDKSREEYFHELRRLNTGGVYVSTIGLNREGGQVELPHKPVIRFGKLLGDTPGKPGGYIVLNFKAQELLNEIGHVLETAMGTGMLVDQHGHFMYSPQPGLNWGHDLGHQKGLENLFPDAMECLTKAGAGTAEIKGRIYSHVSVFPLEEVFPLFARSTGRQWLEANAKRYRWTFLRVVSPEDALYLQTSGLLLVLAALLGITGLFSFLMVRARGQRTIHQEASRRSGERFRNIVEGSIQGVIIHRDGRLLFVNAAAARIHGLHDTGALMAKGSLMELVEERGREIMAMRMGELDSSAGLETTHFEYQGLHSSGDIIWLECRAREITWENGPAIQFTVVDITGRKRSEEALVALNQALEARVDERAADLIRVNEELRLAREQLDTSLDAINEGIAIFDENDILTLANDAMRRLHPELKDMLQPGTSFASLVRRDIELGEYPDAVGREEAFFHERLELHRNPRGPRVSKTVDGRWMYLEESRSQSGWTITLHRDVTPQIEAEQALHQSEERFRDFAESSADWFWETNAELRFTYVSPSIERVLGIQPEFFYGKTRADLLGNPQSPEDKALWEAHLDDLANHRPFRDFAYFSRGGSLKPSWLQTSGTPVFDDKGDFQGYRGSGRDVTPQIEAEQALHQSEERFRDFAESSADWFWEMDADLRFTYMSPTVERLLGVPPESHYGKTRVDLLGEPKDEEERALWEKHFDDLANHRPFRNFTYMRQIGGISIKWLRTSGTPVFAADGSFMGYRGSASDATHDILRERALKDSEERFRNLIEGSLQGVLVHVDLKPLFVNEAFAHMLGYPDPENFLEKVPDARAILHPEERAHLEQLNKARLAGDSAPDIYTTRYLHSDGSTVWVESFVRMVNWNGVAANQTTAIDITSRMRAETDLRQAQKMEAVGQLTGGIAHDFNNILQVVVGYGQLARMRAEGNPELIADLDNVLEAAGRASNLTQQLLTFSRQQVHQPHPLELNSLLENLMRMVRRIMPETIELDLTQSSIAMSVNADSGMLEQMLLNLCINARDAMPEGGRLTLETRLEHITTETAKDAGWPVSGEVAAIFVRDTGVGMDKKTLGQIFEPFFTTKEVGKGTGLGLATAYGIITQHGGCISVTSEPGQGTEFRVCLPLVKEEPPQPKSDFMAESPGGNETILIAEDEPGVLLLAAQLLEHKGYKVLRAENGRIACDLLEKSNGDIKLLLLDVIMPEMGGREVYERARDIAPGVPVVFTTGYAAHVLDEAFLAANPVRIVNKPYKPAELYQVVREALGN